MATRLIEAVNVSFSYPGVRVLQNINIELRLGESHVVIGPNGAGKSTLFRVLSGESPPSEGRILHKGMDITKLDAWQRIRLGFGRTFQVARVFPELSVLENMIVAVECRERIDGKPRAWWRASPAPETLEEAREGLEEFNLLSKGSMRAEVLSHGDKKQLELALCLALDPKVLMLDEPTAGMSPEDRIGVVQLLHRLKEKHGLTLILTEHDMNVVFGVADRLTVLSQGEIVASGNPGDVRKDETVRSIYLGQEYRHA